MAYVADVRDLPCDQIISATEWDGITSWRDLCITLGVDFEQEAKGKARPAIDKVAKRLHGAGEPAKTDKPTTGIKTTKSPSVTVKKAESTTTHTAVTPSAEKMPRRSDFQTEDAFDLALDQWFTANPEKLAKAGKVGEVDTVASIKQAEQITEQVKTVMRAEKPAQAEGDIAAFERSAKPVQTKTAEKPVTPPSTNVDETAQALADLLRKLKPEGGDGANLEQIMAEVTNELEDFRDTFKEEVRGTVSRSASLISEELLKGLNEQVKREVDAVKGQISGTIEIKINGQVTGTVKGHKHQCFEQIVQGAAIRDNMMLVGPAGSGKTTVCEQVAGALGLAFYCQSVCSQTSKSELLGYMDANGHYVRTSFREAFEKGGVFVLDEMDAGNPNVLAVLNSALANTWCSFADGMVKKHADFLVIGCANTFGLGASAQYVGRNALDAATLDRFSIIEFPYDEALETALSPDKSFCKVVQQIRRSLAGERVIVSPRASIQGGKLLLAGQTLEQVMQVRILKGMPENLRQRAMDIAKTNYRATKK